VGELTPLLLQAQGYAAADARYAGLGLSTQRNQMKVSLQGCVLSMCWTAARDRWANICWAAFRWRRIATSGRERYGKEPGRRGGPFDS